MNRAACCTGGLIMLVALVGCRSSIFNPDLGSHFRLPGWAGGNQQVPNPPDSLDKPDTGRAVVEPTTNNKPQSTSTEAQLAAGRNAFRQGRITAATGFLQAVLKNQPQHVEAHHLMAIITGRQHDYTASDHHFETAIATAPTNANLLSDYGYSKLRRFDLATAETLLNRALKIEPGNSFALNNLGTVQARQGRYDEALTTLRKAGSETAAQAKIAQLFPKGRPELQDTAAATAAAATTVTADPPRSLPETPGEPLLPPRELPESSVTASGLEGPLVPSTVVGSSAAPTPPNPLTASTAGRELIPAPAADLPSRPIPWNVTANPPDADSNVITPAGATMPRRRIDPEFSQSAARLGLGIGPGSLVPHNAATPTPSSTAVPVQPVTSPPILEQTPVRPAPTDNASDPLAEFEKQLEDNSSSDRDALRRRLNLAPAANSSTNGQTPTIP